MSIEEFAAFQQACGSKVVKIGDTWWAEPRPFFFRPLFPFCQVSPDPGNYPVLSLLGGILHPVPVPLQGNSFMHLFIYDQPNEYSIDHLNSKHRQIIKKGSEIFTARRLTDFELFVEEASGLYQSFYQRTRYFYRKDRLDQKLFADWAKPIFDSNKVVVMGAYHGSRLAAIEIAYQVEEVIIEDVYFSDTESLALQVTDFMTHTIREAARSSDARYIFRGFPTGKQTLDNSKILRGCKTLKLPAYSRMNPVALYLAKTFMKEGYQKLMAITAFSDEHNGARATGDPVA